ncbi:hypothetical protein VNI00_016345 [Paramarasmius palmivorus]|uniref:Uncharacterized protein n=1 Tax=Paramarasmius palmivorus TaxID=297713 RepID=A0AAW0BEG5_9AGAR
MEGSELPGSPGLTSDATASTSGHMEGIESTALDVEIPTGKKRALEEEETDSSQVFIPAAHVDKTGPLANKLATSPSKFQRVEMVELAQVKSELARKREEDVVKQMSSLVHVNKALSREAQNSMQYQANLQLMQQNQQLQERVLELEEQVQEGTVSWEYEVARVKTDHEMEVKSLQETLARLQAQLLENTSKDIQDLRAKLAQMQTEKEAAETEANKQTQKAEGLQSTVDQLRAELQDIMDSAEAAESAESSEQRTAIPVDLQVNTRNLEDPVRGKDSIPKLGRQLRSVSQAYEILTDVYGDIQNDRAMDGDKVKEFDRIVSRIEKEVGERTTLPERDSDTVLAEDDLTDLQEVVIKMRNAKEVAYRIAASVEKSREVRSLIHAAWAQEDITNEKRNVNALRDTLTTVTEAKEIAGVSAENLTKDLRGKVQDLQNTMSEMTQVKENLMDEVATEKHKVQVLRDALAKMKQAKETAEALQPVGPVPEEELMTAKRRVEELEGTLSKMAEANKDLTTSAEDFKTQADSERSTLKVVQEELSKAQKEKDATQENLMTANRRVKELEGTLSKMAEANKDLTTSAESFKTQADGERSTLKVVQEELSKAQKEKDATQENLMTANRRVEELEGTLSKMAEANKDLTTSAEDFKTQADSERSTLKVVQEELSKAQKEKDAMQENLTTANRRVKELEGTVSTITQTNTNLKEEIASERNRVQGLRDQLNEMRQKEAGTPPSQNPLRELTNARDGAIAEKIRVHFHLIWTKDLLILVVLKALRDLAALKEASHSATTKLKEELQSLIVEHNEELQGKYTIIAKLEQEVKDLKAVQNLEQQDGETIATLRKQVNECQELLATTKRQKEALEYQTDLADTSTVFKTQIASLMATNSDLRGQLASSNAAFERLDKEHKRLKEQCQEDHATMTATITAKQQEIDALKLAQQESQRQDTLADNVALIDLRKQIEELQKVNESLKTTLDIPTEDQVGALFLEAKKHGGVLRRVDVMKEINWAKQQKPSNTYALSTSIAPPAIPSGSSRPWSNSDSPKKGREPRAQSRSSKDTDKGKQRANDDGSDSGDDADDDDDNDDNDEDSDDDDDDDNNRVPVLPDDGSESGISRTLELYRKIKKKRGAVRDHKYRRTQRNRLVRRVLLEAIPARHVKEAWGRQSVPAERLKLFMDNPDQHPPMIRNTWIHRSGADTKELKASPWNQSLAHRLGALLAHIASVCPDKSRFGKNVDWHACIQQRLDQIYLQVQESKPRGTEEIRNPLLIRARMEIRDFLVNERKAQNSSRVAKYAYRLAVATAMLDELKEAKEKGADVGGAIQFWQYVLDVAYRLGYDGMSDEEGEDEDMRLPSGVTVKNHIRKVLVLPWCHPSLRILFEEVDKTPHYERLVFKQTGRHAKFLRRRIDKESDRKSIPKKLSPSFFKDDYLKGMSEHQLAKLQVVNDDFVLKEFRYNQVIYNHPVPSTST